MKRLQIELPDEVFDRLKSTAKATERTMSDIVRRGIEKVIEDSPSNPQEPVIPTISMGVPMRPVAEWRQLAHDDAA